MRPLLIAVVLLVMSIGMTEAKPRVEIPFDGNRKFSKGDIMDASLTDFDDAGWKTVCLPHNWNNLDGEDDTRGRNRDAGIME